MSQRTWCLPVKQTQVWSFLCRASTFLISTSIYPLGNIKSCKLELVKGMAETECGNKLEHLLSNNYNRIKPLPTKSARNYSHIIHSIRGRMFFNNYLRTTILWHDYLEMGKFEKKGNLEYLLAILKLNLVNVYLRDFDMFLKQREAWISEHEICPSKKHLVIPEKFTCAEYFWIILKSTALKALRNKPTTISIPVSNDHCSIIYIKLSIHM